MARDQIVSDFREWIDQIDGWKRFRNARDWRIPSAAAPIGPAIWRSNRARMARTGTRRDDLSANRQYCGELKSLWIVCEAERLWDCAAAASDLSETKAGHRALRSFLTHRQRGGSDHDRSWRDLRRQPKIAFSRFPPVHRADLE